MVVIILYNLLIRGVDMEFCKRCGGMLLPNMEVCNDCGEPVTSGELKKIKDEYVVELDDTGLSQKDTVSDSMYNAESTEESLERYPNCDERRQKEYRKGMRRNEYYVNNNSTDVFYDDISL